MELGNQALGSDVVVKESQAGGVLSVEADINTPLLVGKISIGIQEAAIFDALEKKYPNAVVVAALEMLKGAVSKIG